MTTKIELPWRQCGYELPDMGDTSPLLLVFRGGLGIDIGFLSDEEDGLYWVLSGDGSVTRTAPGELMGLGDYWIYLDELQNPFEVEK